MTPVLDGEEGLASEDGQAIRAVIDAFTIAFSRGDVEALRSLFTRDAVVYPSNDRDRVGWSDIARYWAQPFESLRIELAVELRNVTISGDLAVAEMITHAIVGPKTGGQGVPRKYRDMVVLRRESSSWRIHRNLSQAYPVLAGE